MLTYCSSDASLWIFQESPCWLAWLSCCLILEKMGRQYWWSIVIVFSAILASQAWAYTDQLDGNSDESSLFSLISFALCGVLSVAMICLVVEKTQDSVNEMKEKNVWTKDRFSLPFWAKNLSKWPDLKLVLCYFLSNQTERPETFNFFFSLMDSYYFWREKALTVCIVYSIRWLYWVNDCRFV